MNTEELVADIDAAEYKVNLIMAELREKYPDFNLFVNESVHETGTKCGAYVHVKTTITATVKH